jgi:hypothetical protein
MTSTSYGFGPIKVLPFSRRVILTVKVQQLTVFLSDLLSMILPQVGKIFY